MVKRLRTSLAAEPKVNWYGCGLCSAHQCTERDIVSKSFHGRHGKAYLVSRCENSYYGPQEVKELMTGTHVVRDVFCSVCDKYLGWTYDFAKEEQESYKMHHFVLERKLIRLITQETEVSANA